MKNFSYICLLALLFFCSFVGAELELKINANIGENFSTDFITLTDPSASLGYDNFDFTAPTIPGSYAIFYSSVETKKLSVDVWNSSVGERAINLSYRTYPKTSGTLNLSWGLIGEGYKADLIDYGEDSNYTDAVSNPIDLNADLSYSVVSSGARYFKLTIIYKPNVNLIDDSDGSAGSRGGGGGGSGANKNIQIQNVSNVSDPGDIQLEKSLNEILFENCGAEDNCTSMNNADNQILNSIQSANNDSINRYLIAIIFAGFVLIAIILIIKNKYCHKK